MRRVGLIICVAIVAIQLGLLGYAATRASTPTRIKSPLQPTTQPPTLDVPALGTGPTARSAPAGGASGEPRPLAESASDERVHA